MNETTRRGLFGLFGGATAVAVEKVLPKPGPDVVVGLDFGRDPVATIAMIRQRAIINLGYVKPYDDQTLRHLRGG